MEFPIAECFVSPQGEGLYTGTLMIFLRLAGCTVGTRYASSQYSGSNKTGHFFPIYTNECHLYDGRSFPCDTDYRKKQTLDLESILQLLLKTHPTCKRVCLTGGEPLMHKCINDLTRYLKVNGFKVHLETSGTIPLNDEVLGTLLNCSHVAVSPKKGFIDGYVKYAQEIKILVDADFSMDLLPVKILELISIQLRVGCVFLQPINGEHTINDENMVRCLVLQMQNPTLRISSQSHKLWNVR